MTTNYAEYEGSRKKYLAPLVVIMLCAVALTGAAYAYNTSVAGSGDIKGDYAFIDLYPDSGCTTATAVFNGDAGSFKVYTQTVKSVDPTTGTESSQYNAYVDSGNLVFSAYVRVNTSLGTEADPQYFVLGSSSFKYTAPQNTGTILINQEEESGTLSSSDLKFYEYNEATSKYDTEVQELKGNTPYKVEITLYVTGDESQGADPLIEDNYLFKTFDSSEDAIDAVKKFNDEYSYELTISIGVSEKPAPIPV